VLSESAARWILVLHTALGVAAVGAATHLVLWLRGYLRGEFARHHAVRRFAWIVLALQCSAFVAGNLMYPTYKVSVRAAYLENANAIVEDRASRQVEIDRIAVREHTDSIEMPAASELVKQAAKTARWFDVKEHWIALGILVSAGLVLILSFWDPREGANRALAPVVIGFAVVTAATLWLGAIIGVVTASWRAV